MLSRKQCAKWIEELAAKENAAGGDALPPAGGDTVDAPVAASIAPNSAPEMPIEEGTIARHREKDEAIEPLVGLSLVARSVGKKELASSPAAQAAMKKEWDALRKLGT